MQSIKKKLSENILDKLSMDFLRNQVLKNAYGNDGTFIAKRDPRILLVWYVFFALAPWFVDDLPFLLGCFVLVAVTTVMAKVAPLVLVLFCLGVFSQTGYLFVVSLLFGGNAQTVVPLLVLTLKVASVSLAFHHRVLRAGSGSALQRPDVVRVPGEIVLFHLLRIPDAAHADGGIQNVLCPTACGETRRSMTPLRERCGI